MTATLVASSVPAGKTVTSSTSGAQNQVTATVTATQPGQLIVWKIATGAQTATLSSISRVFPNNETVTPIGTWGTSSSRPYMAMYYTYSATAGTFSFTGTFTYTGSTNTDCVIMGEVWEGSVASTVVRSPSQAQDTASPYTTTITSTAQSTPTMLSFFASDYAGVTANPSINITGPTTGSAHRSYNSATSGVIQSWFAAVSSNVTVSASRTISFTTPSNSTAKSYNIAAIEILDSTSKRTSGTGTSAMNLGATATGVASFRKIENLVDDFSSGNLDKWPNTYSAAGQPACAVVNGRARVWAYTDANNNPYYSGLRSGAAWSLEYSRFRLEVPTVIGAQGSSDAEQRILFGSPSYTAGFRLAVAYNPVTNTMRFRNEGEGGGAYYDNATVEIPYDPVAHRWWGIRSNGTQVFYETSPDGQTWTVRKTVVEPVWITKNDCQMFMETARVGGTNSATDYAEWDNVNITMVQKTGTGTNGTTLGQSSTGAKRDSSTEVQNLSLNQAATNRAKRVSAIATSPMTLNQSSTGFEGHPNNPRTQNLALNQSSTGTARRAGVGVSALTLNATSTPAARRGTSTQNLALNTVASGYNSTGKVGSSVITLGQSSSGQRRGSSTRTQNLALGATSTGVARRASTSTSALALNASVTGQKRRSGTATCSTTLNVTTTGLKRRSGTVTQGLTFGQSSTGSKRSASTRTQALSLGQANTGTSRRLGSAPLSMALSQSSIGRKWAQGSAPAQNITLGQIGAGGRYASSSPSTGLILGSQGFQRREGVGTSRLNLALVGGNARKRTSSAATLPLALNITTPAFSKDRSRVGSGTTRIFLGNEDTWGLRNISPRLLGPDVRQVLPASANATSITQSLAVQQGELIMMVVGNWNGTYSAFGNPTGMGVNWTAIRGADCGSNAPHVRAYYAYAPATATYSFRATQPYNGALNMILLRIANTADIDPIDLVVTNYSYSSQSTMSIGQYTPAMQSEYVFSAWQTYQRVTSATATNIPYSGLMNNSSNLGTMVYGAGTTAEVVTYGSPTITTNTSARWAGVVIATKNGGARKQGRGQSYLNVTAQPEDRYRSGISPAQNLALNVQALNPRKAKSGPFETGNNLLLGIRNVATRPKRVNGGSRVIKAVLGALGKGPTKAAVFTGRPQPPRPLRQKTTRFLAQDIRTRKWLHPDLPISEPKIGWTLSGPTIIEGKFAPEIAEMFDDQGNPLIMADATFIHVEIDGEIRCSGIMRPSKWDGDAWTLRAEGVTSYPHGMYYIGDYAAVTVDPITVFTELWRHLQSFVDAKLGVEVIKHMAGNWPFSVLLGNTTKGSYERQDNDYVVVVARGSIPDAAYNALVAAGWVKDPRDSRDVLITMNSELIKAKNGEAVGEAPDAIVTLFQDSTRPEVWQAAVARGYKPDYYDGFSISIKMLQSDLEAILNVPYALDYEEYRLSWWDLPDIGSTQDDLARNAPFDYWETSAWNATKTDVKLQVHTAYPRVGGKKNLRFVSGENIIETAPAEEIEGWYATVVAGIGAGEGRASTRSTTSVMDPRRVRRMTSYKNTRIKTPAEMEKLTKQILQSRGNSLRVPNIVIDAKHENAPIGTYVPGDDIFIQARVPWLGWVRLWHRITAMDYEPTTERVTLTLERSDAFMYGEDVATS